MKSLLHRHSYDIIAISAQLGYIVHRRNVVVCLVISQQVLYASLIGSNPRQLKGDELPSQRTLLSMRNLFTL